LTPWIRDPGWVKKSRSGINNQDHISESLETIFVGYKILKFFDADPGSRIEKKFGSGIRDGRHNPDPQH
jgi:hypothetical protein